MEQQMRFCTSADGTRIAYGTVGRGLGRHAGHKLPIDIV